MLNAGRARQTRGKLVKVWARECYDILVKHIVVVLGKQMEVARKKREDNNLF